MKTKARNSANRPAGWLEYGSTLALVVAGAAFALLYRDIPAWQAADSARIQDAAAPLATGVSIGVGDRVDLRGTASLAQEGQLLILEDTDPRRVQDRRWVVRGVGADETHRVTLGFAKTTSPAQTADIGVVYAARGQPTLAYRFVFKPALGLARAVGATPLETLNVEDAGGHWIVVLETRSLPAPSAMTLRIRPNTQGVGADTLLVTRLDISQAESRTTADAP